MIETESEPMKIENGLEGETMGSERLLRKVKYLQYHSITEIDQKEICFILIQEYAIKHWNKQRKMDFKNF